MNSKFFILLACAMFFLTGCRSNQVAPSTFAFTGGEVYCLSNPGDGTVTLVAWGTGANRAEAIDAALKQALRQILFKGVKTGPGAVGQSIQPLVTEVNAQERYAYYFDPFFSNGGIYHIYAKEDITNRKSRSEAKSVSRQGDGVKVRIDRSALRQRLIQDGILKP